jgi:hypothetical protein
MAVDFTPMWDTSKNSGSWAIRWEENGYAVQDRVEYFMQRLKEGYKLIDGQISLTKNGTPGRHDWSSALIGMDGATVLLRALL